MTTPVRRLVVSAHLREAYAHRRVHDRALCHLVGLGLNPNRPGTLSDLVGLHSEGRTPYNEKRVARLVKLAEVLGVSGPLYEETFS